MSLLRTVYLARSSAAGWRLAAGSPPRSCGRGSSGRISWRRRASPGRPRRATPGFSARRRSAWPLANEKNQAIAAFCLVGAAIGAGLGLAGGLSNSRLGPQAMRMLRGFIAGGLGGVSGGWIGAMIYQSFSAAGGDAPWWLRPVGWMAAGAMVGLADGLFTLSRDRIRNGVIGGVIGGLIGGTLFDPIRVLVARVAGRSRPDVPVRDHQPGGRFRRRRVLHRRGRRADAPPAEARLADRPRRRPARPPGDPLRGRPDPRQRPRFRPPLRRRCQPWSVAHPSAHRARSRRPLLAPPRVGGRRRRGRGGEGRPPGDRPR